MPEQQDRKLARVFFAVCPPHILLAAAFTVVALSRMREEPVAPLFILLLLPAVLSLSWIVGLFLHELAHAAAGWLVGIQIKEIRVGGGPVLLQWRLGETLFCVRRRPICGAVFHYYSFHERKFAELILVIAGPAMNIFSLALAVYVGANDLLPEGMQWVAFAVLIERLYRVIVMVEPRDVWLYGQSRPNDSKRLLRLLLDIVRRRTTRSPAISALWDSYMQLLAVYWDGKGSGPRPSRPSERIFGRLYIHNRLTHKSDSIANLPDQSDIEALERELQRGLHPAEALYILDSLVTNALYDGRGDLLDRVDGWSRQALSIRPDLATLRGSRGAVLGLLGRYDEALEMLEHADYSDNFNALLNNVFLAQVLFRKGERVAAVDHFETTLAHYEFQTAGFVRSVRQLVERIGREIGAAIAPSAAEGPVLVDGETVGSSAAS